MQHENLVEQSDHNQQSDHNDQSNHNDESDNYDQSDHNDQFDHNDQSDHNDQPDENDQHKRQLSDLLEEEDVDFNRNLPESEFILNPSLRLFKLTNAEIDLNLGSPTTPLYHSTPLRRMSTRNRMVPLRLAY